MQKKFRKSATKSKTTDLLIRTEDKGDTWPKAVLDAAGAFPEFPSLREIRKGYAIEVRRGLTKKSRPYLGK
jgi:hypothetical protein